MSNTENPNVQNPELETEDEGDTDLKVRTNLKAGDGTWYMATSLTPKLSKDDPSYTNSVYTNTTYTANTSLKTL
ncbi:MAG TPA: hypothetical protein PKI03_05840 [Pseudomonadota bacterium]|nr:hypothetical protein [Pseudomonadota bacterium]